MLKLTSILAGLGVVVLAGAGCGSQPVAVPRNTTTPTNQTAATTSIASTTDTSLSVDVVGFWEGGPGSQEVDIYKNGTFNSFLYERPFYSGTWKIQKGILTLYASDLKFRYSDIHLEKTGELNLREEESGQFVTWNPIKN